MTAPAIHSARLQIAVQAVCLRLEAHVAARRSGPLSRLSAAADGDLGAVSQGSALDAMAVWFGLSPFELAVVVLAAAIEISPDAAQLCAAAQGDDGQSAPTPLLALSLFADLAGAAQSSFSPSAPLRYWQLINVNSAAQSGRLYQHISLPDAVLQFLLGRPVLDETLAAAMRVIEPAALLPVDQELAAEIVAVLAAPGDTVVQIAAAPARRVIEIAATAAADLGFTAYHLPIERIAGLAGPDHIIRLWQRDRLALSGMLVVSFEETPAEPLRALLNRLIGEVLGPVVLLGTGAQEVASRSARAIMRMVLPAVPPAQIAANMQERFGTLVAPGELLEIAQRFRLPLATLNGCAAIAAARAGGAADPVVVLREFKSLLRDQLRESLNGLADQLDVRLSFDDLVVPDTAKSVLRQIVARQLHRHQVLEEWGFRAAGGGPQGMSVLFCGPSGTGKTMAAEALAHALGLELYRVDLARIVDKYIGETEKKLAALFDVADATDAILLFDEADVLFGRRTEVRDSHDRYANLEVGYLLQRIEGFRGIAVLTSNLPNAIDEAFARRFAFSLHFEFPAKPERREIWQRAMPPAAPVAALDWDRLAGLVLSGGQIRLLSVNAAMLAADDGVAIGMGHVARALSAEYAKQRRPIPAADLAGWPA